MSAPNIEGTTNLSVWSGGSQGVGASVGTNAASLAGMHGAAVVQSVTYGTPTGPVKLINFPGASATLAQTSAMVAQLIADLTAKGIIGA